MRIGAVLLLLILCPLLLAQQKRCGTLAPTSGKFEEWLNTKIAEGNAHTTQPLATVYQIPVVVHVFHKGEPIGTGVNLSEERIKAQIDSLTADFRRLNADATNTPSAFIPVAADVEIEFVLAKQDPSGNPTNGIVRLKGSRNSYRANTHRSLLRSESYWPSDHYFNIVVTDLEFFIGYASFPTYELEGIINDPDDYIFDGVLVDYQYFGVNPSTPTFESYGRTLTHEVGHFFGLRHIWGDGDCSVDDFVDDTPLADTDNGGLGAPCDWPNENDNTVCVTNEPEMFQNYMDYTDDICMNLFTQGQKARMRTVLENTTNRLSLTSSPALGEPLRFANDLAATDILAPSTTSCSNTITPTLRVVNYGTTQITSYDAQLFINDAPVGNAQNIFTSLDPLASDTVIFSNQLINSTPIDISIQISNINGIPDGNTANNTLSRTLTAINSNSLPFSEDFEGTVKTLGQYGAGFPWEVINAPKEIPTNNAFIFKSHNSSEWFGKHTIFKTPVFDLTGLQSGELRFSYAHSHPPNAFYDGLMVKASVDCGSKFTDILFSGFGPELATAPEMSSYFTPANQLEWADTLISITDYRNIDGVQFAFIGINGGGNNVFIDNIEVVETNLLKNDITPTSLVGPLLTCSQNSEMELRIRNVGSEVVSSFEIKYFVNQDTTLAIFDNLLITSKDYATFKLPIADLQAGENQVGAEIINVNGVTDESIDENAITAIVTRDDTKDEYPLTIDFERADNWSIEEEGIDTLWVRNSIGSNGVLRAKGFSAKELGKKQWFVSPRLSTGGLDSAGLYFRVSYASRVGFTDRFQVLLSLDCGENYFTTLMDIDSDSLASISTSTRWIPSSDDDWREYRLNLPHSFVFDDEIRIAFVFIPGGGNDLYLDDISIRGNEPPTYQEVVRIYPNPAVNRFFVGLNLLHKEPITIQLTDISGKIVFADEIGNAFNQILEYQAPNQEGLYILTIIGDQFKSSQKLFINR